MKLKLKDNLLNSNILECYTMDEFLLMGIIIQLLIQAGFMFNRLGFIYFTDAIRMCFFEPEYMQGKTKVLYPHIAKKYRVNHKTIERNMRYVLSSIDTAAATDKTYDALKINKNNLPSYGKLIDIITIFLLNNIEREENDI